MNTSASNPFLDQVVRDPDSDDARLIYADWLDEQGDPRGAFIRAQCELARLSELDAEFYEAFEIQDALLAEHGAAWVEEMGQELRKSQFNRGFVDEVTILASRLVKDNGQLLNIAPVRWLRPNRIKGKGAALAKLESLVNLRGLDVSGLVIPEKDIAALFNSPHMVHLQRIRAWGYDTEKSAPVLTSLADAAIVRQLTELEVTVSEHLQPLAAAEFENLAELTLDYYSSDPIEKEWLPSQLPALRHLTMHNLSAESVDSLPFPWTQLTSLVVTSDYSIQGGLLTDMGRAGAYAGLQRLQVHVPFHVMEEMACLCNDTSLQSCRELDLRIRSEGGWTESWHIGNSFIGSLCAAKQMGELRTLCVSGIGPGDLARIAKTPHLQQLEHLQLHHSAIDRDDVVALAQSPLRESLRRFDLLASSAALGATKELAAAEFPNVIRLGLGESWLQSGLSDEELMEVASGFPAIRHLVLDSSECGEELLEQLAGATFPELRIISLRNNPCPTKAIQAFLKEQDLPKFYQLHLHGSLTPERGESLTKEFGQVIRF